MQRKALKAWLFEVLGQKKVEGDDETAFSNINSFRHLEVADLSQSQGARLTSR